MAKAAKETVGHNSLAIDRLTSYIERVERLSEEKKALAEDIKEVYQEAKSAGFDTKAMRAIVSERSKDADKMAEFWAQFCIYRKAMGLEELDL